ncbi:MAG: HEPN domain-containing protein [Pyrinomonadaceae bacterium]
MKPKTQEWIEKAEGDWATMKREHRVKDDPNYDAICFHAQQCAEKYLKARLFDANVSFRRTHDLLNLLEDILKIETSWTNLEESLSELTIFAVAYRYPGFSATKEQSAKSVENCRLIRDLVRQAFNLSIAD